MQLSGAERQRFHVELQILAIISPSWCTWVPGSWPGTTFKTYMGQSKRYFEDKSYRYLVPTAILKDQNGFMGLCTDAWQLSHLDQLIFMQLVGSDPNVLRDPHRMSIIVTKAREKAASGSGLLVDTNATPDASSAVSSPSSDGGDGNDGDSCVAQVPPVRAVTGGSDNHSGRPAIHPAIGQSPSVGGQAVRPRGESIFA